MIRFLVMDVDGTLTDGKLYIGSSGEVFKAFSIKDGYGIKVLLPQMGIIPVVITARKSESVRIRCDELSITEVHQGESNKQEKLQEIMKRYSDLDGKQYGLNAAAYIGDDIPDLPCMRAVREAGGVAACPADSADEVKLQSNYICKNPGGSGAVREFIEWLLQSFQ